MKTLCGCTIILLAWSLPTAAQTSSPGRTTARPAVTPQPSPTPKPTPAAPQTPLSVAPAFAGPKYSPAQMDFGTIDYKASSRKTFSLTTPTSGEITLRIPRDAFTAVELRRVPPPAQGNKIQAPRVPSGPITPVPSSSDSFSLVYKWNFAAGEEMQLDVLFKPNSLQDPNPGPRMASLDLIGPGIQPWHVNVPLHGVVAGLLVQANPQTAPSAQAQKPAIASPSASAPAPANALPTPTGPKGAALAPNTPTHSPDNFDFGEVWDGDMIRKTFHLTTAAAGYVTVQLPKGPFRVAEFREMGAVQLPSKNNPGNKANQNVAPVQPVKTKISYQDGQSGQFQWSLAPDTDVQIDVAFQPHFQFGSEMAGQKSANMKVTGPGRHGNWTLSIPLLGMFDGLKISATIVPQEKDLYALAGDKVLPVSLTLYGLDTPVSGTIKLGANPPAGVSITPQTVQVGAKQKTNATFWLSLGKFVVDGTSRPLELVFDDGTKTSKTLLQFTGLANARSFSSGERGDCGISGVRLKVSFQHSPRTNVGSGNSLIEGSTVYTYSGSATDNPWVDKWLAQSIWLAVEISGKNVFKQGFRIRGKKDESTITSNGSTGFRFSADQWKDVLSGSARIGCLLSAYGEGQELNDDVCTHYYHQCTDWKWAAALP